MSLSTLLEAAKYLDYLDSNKDGKPPAQAQIQTSQQRTQTASQQPQQTPSAAAKKSTRRQRSSRKDAANTMLAMSLPASTPATQVQHGVPIPLGSSNSNHHNYHNPHHATSLSSSFTTESPLSSFASTALLCSKVSGVTSASSSAASSLSSSDSSSSCGEILMGDNDFGQSPPNVASCSSGNGGNQVSHSLSHQQQRSSNHQTNYKFRTDGNQSFAHYIAATSAGPQLITMTTTSSANLTSASAPIDGRIRAGHVIAAAANSANATGTGFDPRHFSLATTSGHPSYGLTASLGSDNHLSSPPGSCSPLIMTRVQPMILNSISPSAHQSIMAFQQHAVTASSPTSSSSSYSRHRELHKTLEKNRRAHLRHCFEILKAELPASDCVDKKTSHINIIKSAIRYVLALRQQECEIDNELQRLVKIKNELTDKLSIGTSGQQQLAIQQFTSSTSEAKVHTQPSCSTQAAPTLTKPEAPVVEDEILEQSSSQQQQPAAEQQLSFLLSQSKID